MTTPTAVLFLDLQEEIVKNSRTQSADAVGRAAGVLAKLAKHRGMPVFVSVVPPGGPLVKAVAEPLGNAELRHRTATTAFADKGLVEALAATGAKRLFLAGVASEIVVQRTALDALAAGYQVELAVDACGGVSPRTEDAAWRRITAAGGVTTSIVTICAEFAGDFTTPEGGEILGLMYEAIGA